MKICPQCDSAYEDDYFFCLIDGNSLIDDSGEQETQVVRKSTFAEIGNLAQRDPDVHCPQCGLANRKNSKFCKKCGQTLDVPSPTDFVAALPQSPNPQSSFAPPVFAPPVSGRRSIQTGTNSNNQTLYFVAGGVIVLLIIIGIIVSVTVERDGTNSNTSGAVNATPSKSKHPDIGKTGRLTTNQRIRSAPNVGSEMIGVHYYDARVEVLEVNEYTTPEGLAVWYRVKVLQNGCDWEGIMGCGNDLNSIPGGAAMSGWMSAKNIRLE